MKQSDCKAIVPYVPIQKNESFLKLLFNDSINIYIPMFIIFAFCFYFGYCAETNEVFKQTGIYNEMFTHQWTVLTMQALTVLFLSSFTVFSPAFSVSSAIISGITSGMFICRAQMTFIQMLSLTIYLFSCFLYCCTIIKCFRKSKFGVSKVFKPASIFTISLQTLAFSTIIILCRKVF